MATSPALVSMEEYLEMSCEPECEYVDGELFAKATGAKDHARLYSRIVHLLYRFEEARLCQVATEQSLRVRESAVLIPDVCLLPPDNDEHGIVREPALLCIEVLSPSDRFTYTVKKCAEYLRWGVPACWIFDPIEKQAWFYNAEGLHAVAGDGVLRLGEIELRLTELWP